MASSTLGVYENRNGIDLLYSTHSGMGANLAEIFYLPTGRWDVTEVTAVLHGTSSRLTTMSCGVWQYTASGEPIQSHPQDSVIHYVDGSNYKQTCIYSGNGMTYESGDYLVVFGPDLGSSDVIYVYASCRRLL